MSIKDQLKVYFENLEIGNKAIIVNHDGHTHFYDTASIQKIIINEFPEFLQTKMFDFLRLIDHEAELVHIFLEQNAEFYVKFMKEERVGV